MILPLSLVLGAGAVLAQYDAAPEIRQQFGDGMEQQFKAAIAADEAQGEPLPNPKVVSHLFGSSDDSYQPYKVDCPTGTTFLRSAQSVSCFQRQDTTPHGPERLTYSPGRLGPGEGLPLEAQPAHRRRRQGDDGGERPPEPASSAAARRRPLGRWLPCHGVSLGSGT